jgi:hypothetical protein
MALKVNSSQRSQMSLPRSILKHYNFRRPLGGQRTTRSEERGGYSIPRRAAPSGIGPLRVQRTTRSGERGGVNLAQGRPKPG